MSDIDINELREAIQTFGSQAINEDDLNELINRIEVAEKNLRCCQAEREEAATLFLSIKTRLTEERDTLRTALEKIADWDSAWGPFPETNEAWRAMAIVTAREAVPRRGE